MKDRTVVCGSLLQGCKLLSQEGVEEWFDFPRYRVVAIHMNGKLMFLETLNSEGEIIGTEKMDISSDQWRNFN
jgi:hypothetical protein